MKEGVFMKGLALLGFLAVFHAAGVMAAEKTPPKISIEPPSFDFGTVIGGRTVEKEFIIRNFGGEDLAIAKIVPSCGCTVVDQEFQKPIKAGSTGSFRLSLRVPPSPGHVVKSVIVKSNDPSQPNLELRIEATVVADSH
jgi:hypothetical protein